MDAEPATPKAARASDTITHLYRLPSHILLYLSPPMTREEIRDLLADVDRHQADDAARMSQRLRAIEAEDAERQKRFGADVRAQEEEQRAFVQQRLADLDEADREWDVEWLREHFVPDPGVAERTAAWVREEFPRVAAEATAEAAAWAHAAREEAERLGAKGVEALRAAQEKAREVAAERRASALKAYRETARQEAARARRAEALAAQMEREAERLRDRLARATAATEEAQARRVRLEDQVQQAEDAREQHRAEVARLRNESEQRRQMLDRRSAAVLHSLRKVTAETARAEASESTAQTLQAQLEEVSEALALAQQEAAANAAALAEAERAQADLVDSARLIEAARQASQAMEEDAQQWQREAARLSQLAADRLHEVADYQRVLEELEAPANALRACYELEELIRELEKRERSGRWFMRYDSSKSLCSTIEFLRKRRVVTPGQEKDLHRARMIRNRVVHNFDLSEVADLKQITQQAKLDLAA